MKEGGEVQVMCWWGSFFWSTKKIKSRPGKKPACLIYDSNSSFPGKGNNRLFFFYTDNTNRNCFSFQQNISQVL